MEKQRGSRHRRPHPKSLVQQAIQPCFSGVSAAIFTGAFICIDVVVFLMEGPFLYLNIIYTLYVLFIAAFVFQILIDLGIWEWTKSGSPGTRSFLSRLCPVLCIGFSIPPAALLWHTKNRGGFTAGTSDISLIFSILIVALEVFHLVVTVFVYKDHAKGREDSAVKFSYYSGDSSIGPSPASSIRSSRIDFLMNRSRNSLASIDSGFMNSNFGNVGMHRETAMDLTARFRERPASHLQQTYPNADNFYPRQEIPDETQPYPYEDTSRTRRSRRGSDSSIVSGTSLASKNSDFSSHFSVSKRSSRRKSTKDDSNVTDTDTHSIKSSGSNRSRTRRRDDYKGYRVEEEMTYQPGFFEPFYK